MDVPIECKPKKRGKQLQAEKKVGKEEFVVACGFNKAFLLDRECKGRVLEVVKSVSNNIYRASLAINLLIRETLEADVEAPLDWLFDQTVVRQLMMGNGNKECLPTDTHNRLLPILPAVAQPPKGAANPFTAAAIMYIANWKTHLRERFAQFQRSYFKLWFDEKLPEVPKNERWKIQKMIEEDCEVEHDWQTNDRVVREVGLHRAILGVCKFDVDNKENISTILRYFYRLSLLSGKFFTLAPTKRIRCQFVDFDKTTMELMFGDSIVWKSPIKKKELTGLVSTDGVSVRIHLYRPIRRALQKPKRLRPKKAKITVPLDEKWEGVDKICAVDPGRTNILQVCKEDGSQWGWTRNQYYSECGLILSSKKTERWNGKIQRQTNELSEVHGRVLSVTDYNLHLACVLRNYETMRSTLCHSKYGFNRLDIYTKKQRCVQKMLSKFDENTTIAYGSAGFASGGKGEKSVPVVWVYAKLKKHRKVIDVNEFRTSIVDNRTKQFIGDVKSNDGDAVVSVRGLHWCPITNGCKFLNRDKNAAKNILELALLEMKGAERPAVFCRQVKPAVRPNFVCLRQRAEVASRKHTDRVQSTRFG